MTLLSKSLQGKERDPTVKGLHLSHVPHVLVDLSQLLVVVLQGGQSGVAVGQLAAPLPLLGQQLRLEVQLQLLPQLVPVRLRVLQHLAPPPQYQSSLPSFSLSLFVHLSPAQFMVVSTISGKPMCTPPIPQKFPHCCLLRHFQQAIFLHFIKCLCGIFGLMLHLVRLQCLQDQTIWPIPVSVCTDSVYTYRGMIVNSIKTAGKGLRLLFFNFKLPMDLFNVHG